MIFNNCHLLMTLMIGLHHFFLEMSKKCWPRFRVRNSTMQIYKMYNTTLLKILPASGKLGFISPARSLT
jgi:hypothetical protein